MAWGMAPFAADDIPMAGLGVLELCLDPLHETIEEAQGREVAGQVAVDQWLSMMKSS
jgi:hypothetical protein